MDDLYLDDFYKETRELSFLLFRITSLLNIRTKNLLAAKNLTMARFSVIHDLYYTNEITMGELKKISRISSATLTGLVDALVEGKLVKRWRNNSDRRLVWLAITPAGKEIVQEVIKLRISILQESISGQDLNLKQLNNDLRLILEKSAVEEVY